jgi:hypothetical protein
MIKIINKNGDVKIWKRSKQNKISKVNTNFENKLLSSQHSIKSKLPIFKNEILWVRDKYRTNPLSLKNGGSNIIVEYYSNEIFGYSNIKLPSAYIKKIFMKEILNIYIEPKDAISINEINILKKEISTIYALKHNEETYTEVWNINSMELPWKILESFDLPRKNKF